MAKPKSTFIKELVGTHWEYHYTKEDRHIPVIIELKGKTKKDKKFKVVDRIEKDFKDAVKYAFEIGEKKKKEVRKFEKQEKANGY